MVLQFDIFLWGFEVVHGEEKGDLCFFVLGDEVRIVGYAFKGFYFIVEVFLNSLKIELIYSWFVSIWLFCWNLFLCLILCNFLFLLCIYDCIGRYLFRVSYCFTLLLFRNIVDIYACLFEYICRYLFSLRCLICKILLWFIFFLSFFTLFVYIYRYLFILDYFLC